MHWSSPCRADAHPVLSDLLPGQDVRATPETLEQCCILCRVDGEAVPRPVRKLSAIQPVTYVQRQATYEGSQASEAWADSERRASGSTGHAARSTAALTTDCVCAQRGHRHAVTAPARLEPVSLTRQ